ncbi:MAG TPA: hypothetical protein VGD98_14095 [Ktedonobacteraceae bacterium]
MTPLIYSDDNQRLFFAANGRWDIPLAAWPGPFFLLHFTRTRSPLIGCGGVWLVSVGTMFFFLYQSQFPGGLNPLLIMAVDDEGHTLAASDYFTTDQQTMIAYVPTQGVWTLYAHVGDLFTWLCIAGLLLVGGFAAFASGKRRLEARERPLGKQEEKSHITVDRA